MYNNVSYEQYMQEILGYTPNSIQDTFNTEDYYIMPKNNNYMNGCKLEELYPDIYKKIYPLVLNECKKNNMPITTEALEQMADNIYNSINIDLKIETNKNIEVRKDNTLNRQENRTVSKPNNILRDLIKILILNELIRRDRFSNRQPFIGRTQMQRLQSPFVGA